MTPPDPTPEQVTPLDALAREIVEALRLEADDLFRRDPKVDGCYLAADAARRGATG